MARRWATDAEELAAHRAGLDPTTTTVADWAGVWTGSRLVEARTAATTASRLRHRVLPHWGGVPLDRVSRRDVATWVAGLASELSPKSVADYHGVLAALLTAAVTEGLLPTNPAAGVRLPRAQARPREVFLTREQVEAISAGLRPTDATLVRFLAYTGLRWGEAVGLRWASVDLLRRTVTVHEVLEERDDGTLHRRGYPKSASSVRVVPLARTVAAELAPHGRGEPVFTTPGGALLRRATWRRRVWLPAVQGLDPRPRPHDLRHTAASWLIQAGVPLAQVAGFLGHASVRMTERYAHLAPGADEGVRAVLDAVHDPVHRSAERG